MDEYRLAKFPFLREAARFVKEAGVTLDNVMNDPAFVEAIALGKARVEDALQSGMIGEFPKTSREECLLEILSYPVARIIVSCINDSFLIHRYALAEAVTMNKRLSDESVESLTSIADELGVKTAVIDESLRMHFTSYLRYTSRIRSIDWKLVNTEIHGGFVYLSKQRFTRILQQALQERIEDELPLEVNDDILNRFSTIISEIREMVNARKSKYRAEDFGKVSIVNFPPCMKRFIGMVQAGENIPHSGRFALTAFLYGIGMQREEILKLFSTSPDFDHSKTWYQIEHITGEISGTEYTPPECSTMRSYGICFDPDELCKRVKHPLAYYRRKTRKKTINGEKLVHTQPP